MDLLGFLVLFPLLAAVLVYVAPEAVRGSLVKLGALIVAATSVVVAWHYLGESRLFQMDSHLVEEVLFWAGLVIAVYLLWSCRRIRKAEFYIPVLILVQTGIVLWVEKGGSMPHVASPLYIDSLSVIMVLIIGLVGTLICVYAVSYMRDYHHHHKEIKDRQRGFFFTLFLFLSGMFGVVLANNVAWLFFAWEVTTLCSFLMIGYSRTEEATRNAYRALGLNLVGGVAFALALLWLATRQGEAHTFALNELLELGAAGALIPAALICFAGLTKSAQMPFSSWLLGAMVAPTPVSALLHSSTMVKAGVFIIIKFGVLLEGTAAGFLLALVGAITFLMTSLMAITQSNAKRVLAYSTIANLGLIVMLAGVGTYETIWAAILLTIFHAVAKALLFLAVGTTEHQIGSRDIEDMEGLIVRRPLLAVLMLVGILGMFVAPFGMLISKYASLQALVDAQGIPGGGAILASVLAFGSAPTLFFWSKWMGKIVSVPREGAKAGGSIPGDEWLALGALGAFTFVACVLFQPMASAAVTPFVMEVFGQTMSLTSENLFYMIVMMALLFILPFLYLLIPAKAPLAPGYLAGANVNGSASFRDAMGAPRKVETRNYYLTTFFPEVRLTHYSYAATLGVIVILFINVLS